MVSVEGGDIQQVTNSFWDDDLPKATLDGEYISFVSNRTGKPQIWGLNLNTNRLFQLTGREKMDKATLY